MKRIAYLAPEIPALSATFVYNEILTLQERGYEIVPISVHVPATAALEFRVETLRARTHYLYRKGLLDFLAAALFQFWSVPRRFSRTLCGVLRDGYSVKFARTRMGLFYRFLAACRVACIVREENVGHLHAHFAHVPTDIAMYAASMAGIPFSFTAHANDLFERKWLLREKIMRSRFSITISEFNRNFMIGQGGDPGKIHVIHCGIDSTRFSPAPRRSPEPPYVIGSLGRMVEKKGFDILLKAASVLKKNGVDFRLIIAGNGPLEQKLRGSAEGLGLVDFVEFPGGIDHEQVPAWLHTLDLFVLSCQQDANGDIDGIPVVLMEAMASGVPVVSTQISGIPELIEHKKEGLLVTSCKPAELAQAITQLLLDDELRLACATNGTLKVKRLFEEKTNISMITKLISGENSFLSSLKC